MSPCTRSAERAGASARGQRPWVRAITTRAYRHTDVATARRLLQDLARRLEDRYPSAAASIREGLDETLTVLTLGVSDRLRQSLATTNAIESLIPVWSISPPSSEIGESVNS